MKTKCNFNAKWQCSGSMSNAILTKSPTISNAYIKITKICMEISWRMPGNIANIIAELCQRIPIWSIMIKSCISSVWRLGLKCKVQRWMPREKLKQRLTPGLTLPNKLANTKEKFPRQLDFFFWIVVFGWELRRHPTITLEKKYRY